MMKKQVLAVCAAFMIAAVSNAQLKVGIIAGKSLSTQHSNVPGASSLLTWEAYRGWQAGLVAEMPVMKNLYVRSELLYVRQGAKYAPTSNASSAKVNLNYLELPVNVVYKLTVPSGKLFVGAGASIGYAFSGNMRSGGQKFNLYSGSNDWKRTNISGEVLAGFEFDNGFFASLSYRQGLTDINKTSSTDVKNRSVSISVGYMIEWKRSKGKG